jgi:hypothetical protein
VIPGHPESSVATFPPFPPTVAFSRGRKDPRTAHKRIPPERYFQPIARHRTGHPPLRAGLFLLPAMDRLGFGREGQAAQSLPKSRRITHPPSPLEASSTPPNGANPIESGTRRISASFEDPTTEGRHTSCSPARGLSRPPKGGICDDSDLGAVRWDLSCINGWRASGQRRGMGWPPASSEGRRPRYPP